jgi:hypothetical protein
MNPKVVFNYVMELSALPFFPPEDAARLAIARIVGDMASNEDQVRWLVRMMTSGLYAKWEGPAELRAVFCMKFKPRDGIEALSTAFPDGLSREQLNPGEQIEAPAPLQIAGECGPVTADPEMVALTAKISEACRMPAPALSVSVAVRPDESEYVALTRSIQEFNEARAAKPYTPSQAQIDFIKAEQERNRTVATILEGEKA